MPEDIRIAVIGQAAFGESVLNALVENGEDVCGVFCPPDREGRPEDPVKIAAERHGVKAFQFSRLRDDASVEGFRTLAPDLGIMAFVTDIVPETILNAPTLGTIQYHPSLLPKHRGPSSINWPIIQGETSTGLSIFWPDAGLDTGPILLQKEVTINPDDTLGSVYFDKLFPLGVEAILEAIQQVRAGTAPRIPQDESEATYEGWCRAADCTIDWHSWVDEVYNLIRGADPSPGAGTTYQGVDVRFYSAIKNEVETPQAPGTVVEVTGEGFRVTAPGGSVFVKRVSAESTGKVPAPEWMASSGLRQGDRLGD